MRQGRKSESEFEKDERKEGVVKKWECPHGVTAESAPAAGHHMKMMRSVSHALTHMTWGHA